MHKAAFQSQFWASNFSLCSSPCKQNLKLYYYNKMSLFASMRIKQLQVDLLAVYHYKHYYYLGEFLIGLVIIPFIEQLQSSMAIRGNKENYVAHEKFTGGKIVSPHQMICLLRKNQHNRMWILKQLSQLGINISLLENYSLSDLYKHCDQIIRSTYSIKYLGMNENQMGIISRRIDPFKDNDFHLKQLPQSAYTVNKFFFPKPLKVAKKQKKEEQINIDNLELEIKKAFLKNNPAGCKSKAKLKWSVSGSWLNQSNKKYEVGDSFQRKSYTTQKHLTKNDKIEFQDANTKKFTTSYSRFLSSGLLFTPNSTIGAQK